LLGEGSGHREFLEVQTPNDRVKQKKTTAFREKNGCHLVGATLDLLKQSLDHVSGTIVFQ
jgi:hypothetical protein